MTEVGPVKNGPTLIPEGPSVPFVSPQGKALIVIAASLWFLWALAMFAYYATTKGLSLLVGVGVLPLIVHAFIAYGLYCRVSVIRWIVTFACAFTVCFAVVVVLFRNQVMGGSIAAFFNRASRGRPTVLVLARALYNALLLFLLTVPGTVRREFVAASASWQSWLRKNKALARGPE
ncbi:MAG: hypothetical protein ACYS9X_15525 [Planctomycetota bacterium]|jgi:hypothetical protein